jgi:hypothetical protein
MPERNVGLMQNDTTARPLAAIAIGLGAALLSWMLLSRDAPWIQASDFTYPWLGARAILRGADPYTEVFSTPTPWGPFMLYPGPAFVVALPFAWLPAQLAGACFVGVGAGLLAFFIAPSGYWRLLLFISAPLIQAAGSAQWSPLLTACALWAPALGLLAAKPTIAAPLLAMQARVAAVRSAIIGGAVVTAASFALAPHWLAGWWAALHGPGTVGQYAVPILSPAGIFIALAAVRWRRPEGRLLLAMACVPQKMMFYDQLPLLLIPATRREMAFAVCASLIAYAASLQLPWVTNDASAVTARLTPLVILGVYWPALLLVLARRTPEPATVS